jgi:hypothetical protein
LRYFLPIGLCVSFASEDLDQFRRPFLLFRANNLLFHRAGYAVSNSFLSAPSIAAIAASNRRIATASPSNDWTLAHEHQAPARPADDVGQHAPAAPHFSNGLTSAFISIGWLRAEDQEGECQCQCERDGHYNDEQN